MRRCTALVSCAVLLLRGAPALAAEPASGPADRVYLNGVVFTADARNSRASALAIRDGRILYVGSDAALARYIGPATVKVDLQGRFLMPGLVDGHMHPVEAGATLLKCNLNYASLTVTEMQRGIAACVEQSRAAEPDGWLEVVSWFQENMRPAGVTTSRATLDALQTKRPIVVRSSFGHTVLANSRALMLAKITAATPDPVGGRSGATLRGSRPACWKTQPTTSSTRCFPSRPRRRTSRPQRRRWMP